MHLYSIKYVKVVTDVCKSNFKKLKGVELLHIQILKKHF